MVTFRARTAALIVLVASLAAACSREQQDWRSAEAADTSEGWARFVEQHPDSELAPQARARIAQIAEERDWQHASSVGTAEAYRAFLAGHPNGKLSEQARIRVEAFALGSAPRIDPPTPADAAAAPTSSGVRALQLVDAPAPATPPQPTADAPAARTVLAQPGEAAEPALPPTADAARESAPSREPAASGYGIQLGAFGSEASAGREWQRLQERFGTQLGGLSPRIVVASTNSGQFYRLQAAAAGEAQARAICDSLKEQAQACVPVVPR